MLKLYEKYSRQEVQELFEPDYNFQPSVGSWGISGIVRIKHRPNDWVFFVTYGQKQAHHSFEEGITPDGLLTWQSQPSQDLSDSRVQHWINQKPLTDNIYFFVRGDKTSRYTYLGNLTYLTHDTEREKPVWFQFQISDFAPSVELYGDIKGNLEHTPTEQHEAEDLPILSTEVAAPIKGTNASTSRSFKARKLPDFSEQDERNKSLGLAGEKFAIQLEQERLISDGLTELAERIVHTSVEIGDGAGYDIQSFFSDGSYKYIEVKTTRGPERTGFYISPNELAFAKANPDSFRLMRVFDFDLESEVGRYYTLEGDISKLVNLTPTNYKASF